MSVTMTAGVIKMKLAVFFLTIFAMMISVTVTNAKAAFPTPVASGTAGVLLFVFIWFIVFIIPKLER